MKVKSVFKVKTTEEARDIAKDWQVWQAEQSLSYAELVHWQGYFSLLATKFNLTEEFKENGIL